MSEESVEAIFQHACEGAAESIGSTRTDWQRVADAIRELRRELEAAKQWGTDLSNELTHRTTKLAEARLWLDSSESALQEAQRALFRWLPNRIGSEYDDLVAADAMALMGLESTEGLREVGNEILVELLEKRRLLDDARAQKQLNESIRIVLREALMDGDRYTPQVLVNLDRALSKMRPLYAAPVPPAASTKTHQWEDDHCIKCGDSDWYAGPICSECKVVQPAAVPEAVCINVDDLRETVERHILTAKGDGT